MRFAGLYYLILGIFLTAFGCEQKEDELQTSSEELILGEWKWVESIYYDTPSGEPFVLNPDSVGYHITNTYLADGTYKTFISNRMESTGLYWFDRIVYDKDNISDLRLFTQKDEFLSSVNFDLSQDTLILDNTEADGARRVFVRIQENN